jgi:hypothetical protein
MKKIEAIVFLYCVCFIMTGCVDNSISVTTDEESRIKLFIPNANEIQTYSTATPRENYIEDCAVITFDGSTGTKKKSEIIDNVNNITNNGMATALLPQLSFTIGTGDKVYVICNTAVSESMLSSITTESDINNIRPAKDYYLSNEALPMSGKTESWSTSSVITLTRAVAKIQVKLGDTYNPGAGSDEGNRHPTWSWERFEERYCGFVICNYAGKSNIMDSAPLLSANTSGKTPFYGTHDGAIRFMQYAPADSIAFYVSEYPNSEKDCEGGTILPDKFDKKRLFLLMINQVIEGKPDGPGLQVAMWRLDFYDTATKTFIDIKRNHTYTFTINKIRSTPYFEYIEHKDNDINWMLNTCTYCDADYLVWNNPGSNIEYTVKIEDDWANAIYSNGQYALSVSTDSITNPMIPFLVKANIPLEVNAQIKGGYIFIYDRRGLRAGASTSALEIEGIDNTFYRDNGYIFPIDGTVDTIKFIYHSDHQRAGDLDSANMIIYLGNIRKMIPIVIPLTP